MAAVEYGIIGIRPRGEWDPDTKYDLLNLVTQNGSSYVAHTDPPLGSLPTNAAYWQTSAQGTSKATADSVGTVKPDGTTTEVSTDGSLSVKTAAQNALGLVKGSDGIKVGTDGSIDVNTIFTQATELANIIAEEAISSVLGKISKAIAVTIGLNENALLKNMLTNMDANDQNKIPTSAFVHTLWARIGMGTELTAGANLTAVVEALNSNLTTVRATYPNNHSTTNIVVVRSGNVRILSFSGFPDFTTGSGVFCTLNAIDFPKETVNQEICVRKSNDEWITLTINTTGYVNYECKTAISTSLGMWFNLSYIV